jgi:hypothetical protein
MWLKAEVELERLSRLQTPINPSKRLELQERIESARQGLSATFAETEA